MPSATLPAEPPIAATPATAPTPSAHRRDRSASATTCPTEVVPNAAIAERIGVDDALDRQAHGHPLAPPRRRRRAARPTSPSSPARPRARRTRASTPPTLDLVLVATMTADEITPNAAPLRRPRARRRSAPARSTSAPPAPASSPALAQAAALIETGRAERVLVIGAEALTAPHRLRRQAAPPPLFGDGAGAVVLGADGRRRRSARSCSAPTAALADTIIATPRGPRSSAWTATRRSRSPSSALAESTRRRGRARRPRRSTTSTCSSTTRPTGASSSAVGERLEPRRRRRSPTTSAQLGNTSAASIPLDARRCCARTAACAPATSVLRRRDRRRLHVGRRRDGVGRPRMSRAPRTPPRSSPAPRKGIGAAIAQGARRRRLARRASTTAPTRPAPSATVEAIEEAGGTAVASTATSPTAPPTTLFEHAEERARPRARARQQRRRARATASPSSSTTSDWDTRDRHQPDRRLPADARRAAPDDQGALRPHRQHRLGRRPARQRRPGQLRRRQGRPDRHDQDRRRRGRAARRDRQRGRPRLHRDRHDRGPARRTCRQGDPGPPRPARRRRSPPPCASSPPTTPATSPAPPCSSTAACPPDHRRTRGEPTMATAVTPEAVEKTVFDALAAVRRREPTTSRARPPSRTSTSTRSTSPSSSQIIEDEYGVAAQGRRRRQDQDRRRRRSTWW